MQSIGKEREFKYVKNKKKSDYHLLLLSNIPFHQFIHFATLILEMEANKLKKFIF